MTHSSKWPGSSNRHKGHCQQRAVSSRESPAGNVPALAVLLPEQPKKKIPLCFVPPKSQGEGEYEVMDVNFGN